MNALKNIIKIGLIEKNSGKENAQIGLIDILLYCISISIILYLTLYRWSDKVGIFYGDEFGYISASGYLMGFDWSEQMSHMAYYSAGYSIWLIPGWLFSTDLNGLMKYVIALNSSFIVCSFFLCDYLLSRLFENVKKCVVILVSLLSCLYISNLGQVTFGWTECINVLWVWFSLFLLFKLCEKNSFVYYILFSLNCCYGVIVHMRNITISFAGFIVLIVFMITTKKITFGKVTAIIISLISGGMFFIFLRKIVKQYIYLNSKRSETNDIGKTVSGVTKSVSLQKADFIKNMMPSLNGKIFYISAVTGIIVVIGGAYCVSYIIKMRKEIKTYLFLFSLLAFIFSFGLCVQQMSGNPRYDCLFYGRYYEHTIGFIFAIGMMTVLFGDYKKVSILLVCFYPVYKYTYTMTNEVFNTLLNNKDISSFNTINCMGVSKYFNKGIVDQTVKGTFNESLIILVLLFAIILMRLFWSKRWYYAFCILFGVCISSAWVSEARIETDRNFQITASRYANVTGFAEVMECEWNSISSDRIYYYSSSGFWDEYLLSLQAAVGKTPILNICSLDEIIINDDKTFVVIEKKDSEYKNEKNELENNGSELLLETKEFVLYRF